VGRTLSAVDLDQWIPKLVEMTDEEIRTLPGVSKDRSHQVVAGALVADAVLDIFDVAELEICPWALREGVILERLDQISFRDV
jgi:exopolyphosphatase/guanosine-5'-triphosphate,3'-diphosphate pyrophosphatase